MNRHRLLALWVIAVFAFLYLPVALLVGFSFNTAALGVRWTGFTLHWYERLLADESMLVAVKNSLIIAASTTILSTALGTSGGWLLHRYRLPDAVGRTLGAMILVPMLLPEVLMGVSLLMWFVFWRCRWDSSP